MAIAKGSRLPEVSFKVMTPSGPASKTTSEIFGGKRVVLFGVPGAFTPTCHSAHLPGFLEGMDAFKAKGVDLIACTAVNDVFVMEAWAAATDAQNKILFLADGSGDFAKATGLDLDAAGIGLGLRSKRYAMLVDDGVVTALNIEEVASKAELSTAAALLAGM
jgi:glutaredoxin/glutathione-dependent peroxiredoxin